MEGLKMKIAFNKEEVKELKSFLEELSYTNISIMKAMMPKASEDTVKQFADYSLFEMLKGIDSKMMNTKLSLTGELTVEIKPEFTADFLQLYSKAIVATVPPVISVFKVMQSLSVDTQKFADKWL